MAGSLKVQEYGTSTCTDHLSGPGNSGTRKSKRARPALGSAVEDVLLQMGLGEHSPHIQQMGVGL